MLSYLKSTFKKSPLLALDRGLNELRLLQLEKRDTSYHLEKMLIQPHSSPQDLLLLVQREGLSAASVALALPCSTVLKKQIDFPLTVKENELTYELKQRLFHYFPSIPEEDLYYDYEESTNLLLAVRKGQVQNQKAALEKAGLRLRTVDVDVYALARAGAWCLFRERKEQGEVAALFNLSWPLSSFLVFSCKELIFYHQWRFTQEDGEEYSASENTLPQTLRKIWQLCQATHPTLRIAFLGLAGDLASLTQLPALLQDCFPLPIEVLRPFQGMTHSAQLQGDSIHALSPAFLLCLGLALRGAEK